LGICSSIICEGNSLERIQRYLTIEQEPAPTAAGEPPAYWPASGALRVENLTARYSADGPAVLHGLSFSLEVGEHVGVGELSAFLSLDPFIPSDRVIKKSGELDPARCAIYTIN
jgi:hypothetical protein